ncbi:MAG TPA: hypothetical protein VFW34_10020 [Candidatus Rubrimentiphilum sp.]|nr:hypothetical protein [Candidatus Rubrimentiphilum sp.]
MDQERYEFREVEDARERVAEDVRSVAYNANVVERGKEAAQNKIEDAKGAVMDRVQGAKDAIGSAGMRVRHVTVENPIAMLLAGMAVGFLAGMMLPVTRFESDRIGPMTDQMKDKMSEAGGEIVRRGGEVIKDTIEATKEAAAASIRTQTAEMMPDDTASMT